VEIAWAILADPNVKPCGLGARDSLRLEAGLCLYGHDINEETTPKTANLLWAIGKPRKEKGGFIGDHIIIPELKVETKQRRVGLNIQGAPAREGAPIIDPATNKKIGVVTSGTFSPILKQAVAMAYVDTPFSKVDTAVQVEVRGKLNPAKVVKMPFVPTNYKK
jgi:aminomethyltransferase